MDRDATAEAVVPAGMASEEVVMTVTPVAKWPATSLKNDGSTVGSAVGADFGEKEVMGISRSGLVGGSGATGGHEPSKPNCKR
jgi:hypothetical protein